MYPRMTLEDAVARYALRDGQKIVGKIPKKIIVECVCGSRRVSSIGNALVSRSCGCRKREFLSVAHKKHGHTRLDGCHTKTYMSWAGMKARCKAKSADHAYYFDRGITVCARWYQFENFLADMGERPKGTEIDRIENDKGYYPGNCRWATHQVNCQNTRRTRSK